MLPRNSFSGVMDKQEQSAIFKHSPRSLREDSMMPAASQQSCRIGIHVCDERESFALTVLVKTHGAYAV